MAIHIDSSRLNPLVAASLITYILYHKLDPKNPTVHFILLLVAPGLLAWFSNQRFPSVVYALLVTYPTYWSLLLLFTAAYRLSPFHPLYKFPGPPLARLSKLWFVYQVWTGNVHEIVRRLHRQYGDAVRIGPNELSFARADSVMPILGMKALMRGPYYDTRKQPKGVALDGLREWTEHASRRKPWARAMSTAALKEYSGILIMKIQELVTHLSRRTDEVVDISAWLGYFSTDFMSVMAFDHDFGQMKAGSDTQGIWHLIEDGLWLTALISHIPWIVPLLFLLPGSQKLFNELQGYGLRMTEDRMKNGSKTKDLFYYLAGEDQTDNNEELRKYCTMDGILAIIAGSDTSATALAHMIYFMLQNPRCLSTLRREIDDRFPNGNDPTDFSAQADMPYLNACINEVLRLYPPVMTGLQRRVEFGTGGIVISDHFVPEDTQVSAHTYSMQRDPRYFYPLPDVFWPDRWLEQTQYTLPSGEIINNEQLIVNRECFVPFSTGPQNCAGRNLAWMELRAVTCWLFQKLDFDVAKGYKIEEWEHNIKDFYVTSVGKLPVRVRARQ